MMVTITLAIYVTSTSSIINKLRCPVELVPVIEDLSKYTLARRKFSGT